MYVDHEPSQRMTHSLPGLPLDPRPNPCDLLRDRLLQRLRFLVWQTHLISDCTSRTIVTMKGVKGCTGETSIRTCRGTTDMRLVVLRVASSPCRSQSSPGADYTYVAKRTISSPRTGVHRRRTSSRTGCWWDRYIKYTVLPKSPRLVRPSLSRV
jgi:hypothetical protein